MFTGLSSRRGALQFCTGVVAAATLRPTKGSAEPVPRLALSPEAAVRRYYGLWERKDWGPFDMLLASDFTFTSANDDDHISKAAFKTQCWDTQIDFIKNFDIEALATQGSTAFVRYLCHTRNGKSFRNVEYHNVRDGRITSIECYFGAKSTFASAVASQPS